MMFLPGVLAVGALATYTDLKEGVIRNKHLALGAIYALLLYALDWTPVALLNAGLAALLAYLLWHVAAWTAGDAKLYIVFAMLIPIGYYNGSKAFPASAILLNTFIPLFVYFLARLLLHTTAESKINALRKLSLRRMARTAVALFAFLWPLVLVPSLPQTVQDIFSNIFVVVMALFLVFALLERLHADVHSIATLVALLRLFLDPTILTASFWLHFGAILLVFVALRLLLVNLAHSKFVRHVDLHLLRPGMLPAEMLLKDGRRIPAIRESPMARLKHNDSLFQLRPEGLTEQDCRLLRRLKREGKIRHEHLKVQQTVPFAVFLFAGALITVMLKTDMISFAAGFIPHLSAIFK